MNSQLIHLILDSGIFPHAFRQRKLVETHISYVILGRLYAYKFKKEIKYSFADFSTIKKRKYFCEREIALNNRLSKGIYLEVVPVRRFEGQITIDGTKGRIVDYAVKMKCLKDAHQMHLMLLKNQVTKKHIRALAILIRNFHERTDVIHDIFQPNHFSSRFNDILSVSGLIQSTLGATWVTMMENAVRASDEFLRHHSDLFKMRIKKGWVRDCHGDLHSRNIFLCPEPIVFDCLEFNDEFRKTDILDELAFFCMDLEADGHFALSKAFTQEYFRGNEDDFGKKEQLLFTYYKCYRANVRAKVIALRAMKPNEPFSKANSEELKKYLSIMNRYLDLLI